jgi:hypothetical protein
MPRRGHSETRKIRILSTPGERIAIQQLNYIITLKNYIVKGPLTKRPLILIIFIQEPELARKN